jgi:hypothetical protein
MDHWLFAGNFADHASESHWNDFACTIDNGIAVISSTVPHPAGFAALGQEVLADAFGTHAQKVTVHLDRLAQVYGLTADALDAIALVVEGAKIAVVAQLAALAAEIAAAAAASIFTFGLSDAAGLAATALTRVTVQQVLDALERQVISLAEGLAVSEALAALAASAASLAGQAASSYVGGAG